MGRYLGIVAAVAVCATIGAAHASAADRVRPSKPKGFAAKVATETISVAWRASKDNVRVKGYRVFRNGRAVATVRHGRKYALRRLRCGTRYLLMVSAYDAARNRSRPATIFARTKPCRQNPGPGSGPGGPGDPGGPGSGVSPPVCPTSSTVVALLLEHKINVGCSWPDGHYARQAIESVEDMLADRRSMLTSMRSRSWLEVALQELEAATRMQDAWTVNGVLQANPAGLAVQYKVGRVIRILQWTDANLYAAAQSEKFALTAISWYMAASEYGRHFAEEGPTPTLSRGLNAYRAWGRYRQVWQRLNSL